MKQFGLINEIDVKNKRSWENKIFITIDIDWAHDEILRYTANILTQNKIKATWFVTHDTPVLNELRSNTLFELGIHPNYNPLLLNGIKEQGCTAMDILNNIMQIVPEASCVRSHGLTQNSTLVIYYVANKFKNEMNVLIPIQSGIKAMPYEHPYGITEIPHIWEDDVHMLLKDDYKHILHLLNAYECLTVLDFHPIHIYLNETNIKHYEESKCHCQDMFKLKEHINKIAFGTKDFLISLIETNKTSD